MADSDFRYGQSSTIGSKYGRQEPTPYTNYSPTYRDPAISRSSVPSRRPSAYSAPQIPYFLPPEQQIIYTGGGGSTNLGYQKPRYNWEVGSYGFPTSNPLAPDWWQAFQPKGKEGMDQPDVVYSMLANTLIPFLSPEDQARFAENIYQMWDTDVSAYRPMHRYKKTAFKAPYLKEYAQRLGQAGGVSPDYFRSSQRANEALEALSAMREATVGGDRWKLGPGYKWLQSLLETVKAYEGGKSKGKYIQMMGALDPMLAQAGSGSDLAAFAPLAQSFLFPYFGTGPLVRASQAGNAWQFGTANPMLRF